MILEGSPSCSPQVFFLASNAFSTRSSWMKLLWTKQAFTFIQPPDATTLQARQIDQWEALSKLEVRNAENKGDACLLLLQMQPNCAAKNQ